jgi:hypothetical protein
MLGLWSWSASHRLAGIFAFDAVKKDNVKGVAIRLPSTRGHWGCGGVLEDVAARQLFSSVLLL